MRVPMAVLIVALVAIPLAGCLGGDDKADPKIDDGLCSGPECAVDGDVDAGLGRIFGNVVDEVFRQIVGANVTLREKSLTTKTDAAGKYAFNNLAPGTYTVYGENRPTHAASGRQITVSADQHLQADLILVSIPPPAQPYSELYEQDGLIGCSVSFMYLQGTDYCGLKKPAILGGGPIDPNANSTFFVPIDAGLTGMVVWLGTTSSAIQEASLLMEWIVPVAAIEGLSGPSPLEATYEFNPITHLWTAEPVNGRFTVKADPNAGTPQLAYQQKISARILLYYNGEPIPPDQSAAPDT